MPVNDKQIGSSLKGTLFCVFFSCLSVIWGLCEDEALVYKHAST